MSVRGRKRPLSVEDEQNSPEDLLLLQQMEDPEMDRSPKRLLSLQPVTDPYSSEGDNLQKAHDKKLAGNKITKEKKYMLQANAQASDMTAPEVLYFFDLDYTPQLKPPLDLQGSSVTQILEAIFTFTFQDDTNSVGKNFKISGKKMDEIFSYHLEKRAWLKWMLVNDVVNFKTFDHKDWVETEMKYLEAVESSEEDVKLKAVYEIIALVHRNYVTNKCTEYDKMKDIFLHTMPLLPITAQFRFNAMAKYRFKYHVPEHLVSKSCDRIACASKITVKPDTVYATRNKFDKNSNTGKIVVQVDGPKKDGIPSSSSKDKLQVFDGKETFNLTPTPKPARTIEEVLSKEYKESAMSYLRWSVPGDCRDDLTCNKMTGEHALQLISVAAEQKENAAYCDSLPLKQHVPVGIFLKNEYLYFTKLEINDQKLKSYCAPIEVYAEKKIEPEKGTLTYSHWRLDLTIANHRIGFLVFLLELLEENVK